MKITIGIDRVKGKTNVVTLVDIDGNKYTDGNVVIPGLSKMSDMALELEILESVKRHIIRIQEDILKEVNQ